MSSEHLLVKRIRTAFGPVPFPIHRGLRGAMKMDEWIHDEAILRETTQRKDHIGEWWEIPISELLRCMMALDYLDGAGMEFYLPAYMTAVVASPGAFDVPGKRSSVWQVISTMLPNEPGELLDVEMHDYFQSRFNCITNNKREVCRDFLKHVATTDVYDKHAMRLAGEAINHEYWSADS